MNLILLGAPGAGKGTQAELLMESLAIPAISTGNMLRDAMKHGTPVGQRAKEYMDSGLLVPDDVIMDIVAERVAKPDCAGGFILDGVPRTLAQAQALERAGIRIDHVISIEVDDSAIEERMAGRRVCSGCGASFHVVANPPKQEGICDFCGQELICREDDAPETVRRRLQVYHGQTEVLKAYYAQAGKLRLVPGGGSIETIHAQILQAIGAKV